MERITKEHLERACDRLNRMTDNPLHSWEKEPNGKHTAAVGNFHISYQNGGVALYQHISPGGGCNNTLRTGHMSKRALLDLMHAFMTGIEFEQEKQRHA